MKLDSLGSLFANSWKRYRERFADIIAIFLVPLVLIGIAELLLLQKSVAADLLGFIIELLGIILSIAATSAMISAVGKNTDFVDSYKTGFRLFWAYLWLGILVELAALGGFFLLIIPGIILSVQLAFVVYVLVLEGKHGMAALYESREYVKGYWWAFFGRGLLLALVMVAAMLIIFLPALLIFKAVGLVFYFLIVLFLTPFAICYQYEIFDNFRRLKPTAAEDAVKAKHEFVKVAMVFGVIGIVLGFILLCLAVAFLPKLMSQSRWNSGSGYPPNGFMPGNSANCPHCEIQNSPPFGDNGAYGTGVSGSNASNTQNLGEPPIPQGYQ